MIDDDLYDANRQGSNTDQSKRHNAAKLTERITGNRRTNGSSCDTEKKF